MEIEFYGFMIYMLVTHFGWKVEDIMNLTVNQAKFLIDCLRRK